MIVCRKVMGVRLQITNRANLSQLTSDIFRAINLFAITLCLGGIYEV